MVRRSSNAAWVIGLGLLAGCEARSPEAPSPPGESVESIAAGAAARPEAPMAGEWVVRDPQGTLDIRSRHENTVNLRGRAATSDAPTARVKFGWTGHFIEGYTPFDMVDVGVPGRAIPLDAGWAGIGLLNTPVVWDKITFTGIGGAMSNYGGVFAVAGTATLPEWTGQLTDKATGTFTLGGGPGGDTFVDLPQQVGDTFVGLTIRVQGSGTVTAWLAWVPIPLEGLPDGYWRVTRVLYRFR